MLKKASCLVKDTLDKAGFVTHIEKSHWEPSSTAKWLGLLLDLGKGCVMVLPEKIAALKDKIAAVVGGIGCKQGTWRPSQGLCFQ